MHRKVVTVLFCDVVGSTAMGETVDPEALQGLLARYFERMRAIVESHGGSVEKFIGDAVMAVFGVPQVHEDDALRACRAAVEMREAFPELGMQGRIGVNTGEVVTGTEERLATGDTVNVAARFQNAADPGEILIGETTLELLRRAVETEPVEPMTLKGKAELIAASRLLSVLEEPDRSHAFRFVGREQEVELIHAAWHRALAEQRCELVTIVGDAGIGKSRLVAEGFATVDARVVRGRCLPYGEGITYWPVVEVIKQLDALPTDAAAAAAIRALLGDSDRGTSAEEIGWAVRKLLEEQAPLVVVLDDIQWGEETFLNLVEGVGLLSSGAPILLLCMARPELAERRPTWPVTIRLEPLAPESVNALVGDQVSADLRRRIVSAAGGNPLFVTEMLVMTAERGVVEVPPTLRALLGTRLDQLPAAERTVLERGAVEGELFHRGAVQALSPEEAEVTPNLAALTRKELIRPDRAQLPGEDGFRFRHLLIRDAAYDALPKTTRAVLHERFADWLEVKAPGLVELDEILGYHLEQACRYRAEVGLPKDDALAATARRRLTKSGQRAAHRQDYEAAASLLERAAALVPPTEIDLALESELGEVLFWTGRAADALERADALAERAAAAGNRVGELCGRIKAALIRLDFAPESGVDRVAVLVQQALPELEAAGDDLALYIGYYALGNVTATQERTDAALEAFERALVHAQRSGHEPSMLLGALAWCRFMGTTPVSDLVAWLDENEPHAGPDQFFRAYRAWSFARLGRFEEARTIIAEARVQQAERGGGALLANLTAFESVWIELLADDPAAAAVFGAEGCRLHEEIGEQPFLASAAGSLAQALYALDRLDEADAWAGRTADLASESEAWANMLYRQVRGKVLARRGEHIEAQRLAREAVAFADNTDNLDQQGDAYADLAEVLRLGDKPDDAAAALHQALGRYERKGNLVSAERTRTRLFELRDSGADGMLERS